MRRIQLLAAGALVMGCGGSDTDILDPEDGGPTVTVTNNQFNPTPITVPVNGTVTWQWSSGGVTHNVTFEDGPTSGDRSSGTYPRTFQAGGSYPYVCTIHVNEGMAGVVNVTAGGSGSGGGGGGGGDGGGGGGGGYP